MVNYTSVNASCSMLHFKLFIFSYSKMCELLYEQYNSVFSTPDPTMTIKCPKDFFGHPQANTLSDINIYKRRHN